MSTQSSHLIDDIRQGLADLICACTPDKQPTAETVKLLELCLALETQPKVDIGRLEALEDIVQRMQPVVEAWEERLAAQAMVPPPLRTQRRSNLGP